MATSLVPSGASAVSLVRADFSASFAPPFIVTLAEGQTVENIVNEANIQQNDAVETKTPSIEEVKAEIIRQAAIYGVNVNTALRISRCESGYVYNAKSKISTAKGVFQFIDGTWKWIGAAGHQYDYKENIKQFMIWYPKFPSWWECK